MSTSAISSSVITGLSSNPRTIRTSAQLADWFCTLGLVLSTDGDALPALARNITFHSGEEHAVRRAERKARQDRRHRPVEQAERLL